jgi:hypothetical protein
MKPSNISLFGCHIWLSLATSPFLLTCIALESMAIALIDLGQASEELFRGTRLPLLNFPESQAENQES